MQTGPFGILREKNEHIDGFGPKPIVRLLVDENEFNADIPPLAENIPPKTNALKFDYAKDVNRSLQGTGDLGSRAKIDGQKHSRSAAVMRPLQQQKIAGIQQDHERLFADATAAGQKDAEKKALAASLNMKRKMEAVGSIETQNLDPIKAGQNVLQSRGGTKNPDPIRMMQLEKKKELLILAERLRYIEVCNEVVDCVRNQDMPELLRCLEQLVLLADQLPTEHSQKAATYFTESRLSYNEENGLCTYDDIVFEVVNFVDPRSGFTPLMWSILHDWDRGCDLLLTCRADVTVQHPLKKAVIWKRFKSVEVLIRHGADRLQKDEDGRIPFEHADKWSRQGHEALRDHSESLRLRLRHIGEFGADTENVIDDDAAFLMQLVKPTEEDLSHMARKAQERDLAEFSTWTSTFDTWEFYQDMKAAPRYFVVTADRRITLTNEGEGSRDLFVSPGVMLQCLEIEQIPAEPLCFWVRLTTGLQVNGMLAKQMGGCVSGWVMWDRRDWNLEANRLGLIPGANSKTKEKETATAFVATHLALAQDSDSWVKLPSITPVQMFDSEIRKVVTVRSTIPLRARSGPTLSKAACTATPSFQLGETVLTSGQLVLDGGWIFYLLKKRWYGRPEEKEVSGWMCARDRDYHTIVLRE